MTKAIVIRTMGDTSMTDAIVSAMKQQVIPVDDGKRDYYEARLGVMQPRDSRYWMRKIKKVRRKYGKPSKPSIVERAIAAVYVILRRGAV